MPDLLFTNQGDGVAIATAATSLPFPPVQFGSVTSWNREPSGSGFRGGVFAEFDLEVWAAGAVNLTDAELFAGSPQAQAIADVAVSAVDHTQDLFTAVGHGLSTGDGPLEATTAGSLPGGLAADTGYFVIVQDADTFQLAATLADALADVAVPLSSNGAGGLTLVDTADTERVRWFSHGKLGQNGSGTVSLTAERAYHARCLHRPRAVAYALVATLSAAVAVSARAYPLSEI